MPPFATYPDLKNKVALVMGIGQSRVPGSDIWGNGAAIARFLAHNDAKVFGCDLSLQAAGYTSSRIRSEGGICDIMTADVTSAADVQNVADAVLKKHGRIDILINNVGATATGDPASMSEEAWDKQIQINLKPIYLACHIILPIMESQQSGVIINNASIAGLRYIGKPQVAYSTAKAAVIHFTRVTGVMYAPKGIRVNAVAPGLIYTPLVESLKVNGQEEAYRKIMEQPVPMGRMGSAHDVASAVGFLASESAGYITGQCLVVDGGFTGSSGVKL
ncbi:SDR family NAD(P)-dependent oxidoreductase [Aspergillus stella-maris]|uniref:SDR family NAD(P)-dependent oxidoreductase n=1 Tax=Aspergillus stella-maris TaxID=1810926 RepID=UPI003CCE4037